MKVIATVDILNRLAQAQGFGSSSKVGKACKGILQVRNRADGRQVLVLSTHKEISAQEYDVGSIQTFRTQFINDGRATIEVNQPPMSIMMRNCKPEELRVFIDYLKKLRAGKEETSTLRESQNGGPSRPSEKGSESNLEKETPGTLRKSITRKRARSPELSKTEKAKIKKTLRGIDRIVSVKDRANYPKEFAQTIEYIKIVTVRLRKIDTRMLDLKWLNHLDLTGNCLKNVDELARLKGSLKVLVLANNEINTLPEDIFDNQAFRSLVHLDLSRNKLTVVPSSVLRLKMLADLNVKGNCIRFLPYNWMDMKSLRNLYVGENQLTFMPASLKYLQLNMLELSENPNLHTTTDFKPDYVGYSTLPTLFERASEVVMNFQRKERYKMDETLPSIIKSYLRGGMYCIRCGKLSLRYKITKENVLPRELCQRGVCTFSACQANCLVKTITCFTCEPSSSN